MTMIQDINEDGSVNVAAHQYADLKYELDRATIHFATQAKLGRQNLKYEFNTQNKSRMDETSKL